MSTTSPQRLSGLNELADYRVCAENPDPRGWSLVDSTHLAIGKVSDLIVDLDGLVARYMVCTLEGGRAVLLPVGFARLDGETCTVHLDYVTAADLDRLPAYTTLPLSTADLERLEEVLTGANPSPPTPAAKIIRRS